MLEKEVRGHKPQFGANFWAAENATVVGECIFGKDCTVWFGAVVRGDVNRITFGDNCNIQDNATVHCTFEQTQPLGFALLWTQRLQAQASLRRKSSRAL